MHTALNRRDYLKLAGSALAVAATGRPTWAEDKPQPAATAAPGKQRQIPKAIMYATIGLRGTVQEKVKEH